MSLVLEALRRVEKPDAQAGIVGVAVPSYRPVSRKRRSLWPLALGLGAGGLLVLAFGPASRPAAAPDAPPEPARPRTETTTRTARGGAGLPPPLIIEPTNRRAAPRPEGGAAADLDRSDSTRRARLADPRPELSRPSAPGTSRTPAFVLQAISERDSKPIAVINDQLVKEGDRLAGALVVKIGAETVEIVLDSGARDLVRFAPPPPPEPSPTSSPESR